MGDDQGKAFSTGKSNVEKVGAPDMSVDDLFTKLVKGSPRAEVTLAGIPVECVLDTGAETSLISAVFYREHLEGVMSGVKPLGTYLRVYGVGQMELPVEGYVEAPLVVHDRTVTAHFLVVKDPPCDKVGGRRCPVLLGCNVLHLLRGLDVDPKVKDAEAWNIALQWYRFAKEPIQERSVKTDRSIQKPVAVRTGRKPMIVPPRQVQVIKCHVRAPAHIFQNKVVVVTGLQTGLIGSVDAESDGVSNLSETGQVYNSCDQCDGKTVGVLVANLGARGLVIPPYTRLGSVREAAVDTSVGLESGHDGIAVSVNHILTEHTGQPGVSPAESGNQAEEGAEPLPETFRFSDGTVYQLPPGLSLNSSILNEKQKEQVARLVQKHDGVFSKGPFDVGFCDRIPHKITTVDEKPISEPYRRIAPHQVQEVKDMLQNLLDQGIIKKSDSSYASPVVLVKKRDGSLRICVDFRKLNSKTIKDSFPLPRIEESLEALRGSKYFTSLDLAHGYHQVAMDVGSVGKTAFRVPFGLYEFTRMPFGLANAPGTFQRVMEMCLGDLNLSELLIYLDDILVFSSSVEEHLDRLDKVFCRLGEFGLKIKGKKCSLFRDQVLYLGHVIDSRGISVDEEKIQRVRDWPIPQTAEQLRSFLGLAGYYRRFVKGFSQIAAPLHALLPPVTKGKNVKRVREFRWNEEAQAAFDQLKQALVNTPVLAYPDFGRPFVLEVDASLKGLGACLIQEDAEGRKHPVAYASRGLRGVESKYPNYSSFKIELLALKWAVVDKFRDYLMGMHFTVLTDNNPLSHIQTAKLGACESRWVAQLSAFDFDIKFRSGASNRCADALSRYPGHCATEEVEEVVRHNTGSTKLPLHVGVCEVRPSERDGQDVTAGPPGVFPSWSPRQLAELQKADPVLKVIWDRWERRWRPGEVVQGQQGDPPALKLWIWQWSRFVERDGVLCRRVEDPLLGELYQVLLPASLQQRAIEGCHEGWGHQGVVRTCSLLRRRVYWPKMAAAVRRHIGKCQQCVLAKATQPVPRVPMRHLLAFRPLEILAIDFVKIDRGRGGYEDVLVMTDVYTKFVQAVPCRDQCAETVAKALRDHWFSRFGIPNRLHSDQGRNFEGDVVRELCALYGIKKSRTTPYHPEGNAQAERYNRTLFGLIKSVNEQDRRKWPDLLPHLTFVYNATPHCSTGVAPYTLMFGREPLIPLDQILGRTDSDWEQDFTREQEQLLTRAKDLVTENVKKRSQQNETSYNAKAKAGPIPVGAQVLLRKCAFKGRHKIQDKYERAPYKVVWVNQHGDVYRIRPVNGGQEKTVNRKYLMLDPLAESDLESTDNSDEDSEDGCLLVTDENNSQELNQGLCGGKVGKPLSGAGSDGSVPLRRSRRSTRGTHRNPFRLPQSTLT